MNGRFRQAGLVVGGKLRRRKDVYNRFLPASVSVQGVGDTIILEVMSDTPSFKAGERLVMSPERVVEAYTPFKTPESVVDYFRDQVTRNGTPRLAGLEEEIIVLNRQGKPLSHQKFQEFLGDFIRALPEGEVIAGKSVRGEDISVLKGKFKNGFVQPETNTTLVEFAHNPTDTVWGSFLQSRQFTSTLMRTASEHDVVVIGSGSVPTINWQDFKNNDVVIPNADFAYSWGHMTNGTREEYCRTVFGTASVHHNMGFNDPELMARYIATSLRIQPTMIALLGNSPLWDSTQACADGLPLLSHRSRVQIDYGKIFGAEDGVTYLYPDFLIAPEADFASIVEGYLDLPLDRTIVNGKKIECHGLTMRQYLNGYEYQGEVHYPCEDALTMMIREPIVDVRPCFTGSAPRVETRAHDAVSQHVAVAIDAFYRGILANLDEAHSLMTSFTNDEIRRARHEVCEGGLCARAGSPISKIVTQQDLAKHLLTISQEGLAKRGHGEEALLAPLFVLAETGYNPAERLLLSGVGSHETVESLLNTMRYDRTCFADNTSYRWCSNPPRSALFSSQETIECVL